MSVAVVGAGPAGMIVATVLAHRGEVLTLIDEQPEAGGHLTYDRYETGLRATDSGIWLTELQTALDASTADVLRSAVAWAAFRTNAGIELAVNCAGAEEKVLVDQVVVAAGTTDLPLVAPGATLPGVMTSRAIRILLNRHHVIPGQRVVIVGDGAEVERLRNDVIAAGCDVVAVIGAEDLSAIAGAIGVETVTSRDGQTYPADIVVVARGEVPDLQVAGMLEVPRLYDAELGGWRSGSGDCVHLAGGALLGFANPKAIIQSAVAVADRIHPAQTALSDCGLTITGATLQSEVLA